MTFWVWATLMTEESVKALVAGLVHNGCQVSPLAKDDKLGVMGESSCLAAIVVKRSFKGSEEIDQMVALVKKVLDKNEAHYFSIIVRHTTGSFMWAGEAPGERRK